MELPPFNYPNVIKLFGGAKQASFFKKKRKSDD